MAYVPVVTAELNKNDQQNGFIFRIENLCSSTSFRFTSLTESLSSGVGRFCHMIKLIKRRDSTSESGIEFQ